MPKTLNALAALGALKGASHGPLCGAVVVAQLFTCSNCKHVTKRKPFGGDMSSAFSGTPELVAPGSKSRTAPQRQVRAAPLILSKWRTL